MPIKQQYFIAISILVLVAVMVIFIAFDFFSDQKRYADPVAWNQNGQMMYQNGGGNGAVRCAVCGGAPGTFNARCPNCSVMPGAVGAPPAQQIAPGLAGNAQRAGFLWFQSPTPKVKPLPARGALSCPKCAFTMSSKFQVAPNTVRCPRCPSYLINANPQVVVTGQRAAFAPGYTGPCVTPVR